MSNANPMQIQSKYKLLHIVVVAFDATKKINSTSTTVSLGSALTKLKLNS